MEDKETKEKEYKVFPVWLIAMCCYIALSTLAAIGRHGFTNMNFNIIPVLVVGIIIIYRVYIKDSKDSDNNGSDRDIDNKVN